MNHINENWHFKFADCFPEVAGVYLGRYHFFHKLLLKGAVSWELSNFKQWKLSPNWVSSIYKTRHGWTNLKKIKRDCNRVFWKLVNLTVFQSPFLLFVTFNIMIERHICLKWSCDFVICQWFFRWCYAWLRKKTCCLIKWTRQQWCHRYSVWKSPIVLVLSNQIFFQKKCYPK